MRVLLELCLSVCAHRSKSKFGDEQFRFFGFLVFTQCIVNATVAALGEGERLACVCVCACCNCYACEHANSPHLVQPSSVLTLATIIHTVCSTRAFLCACTHFDINIEISVVASLCLLRMYSIAGNLVGSKSGGKPPN